MIKQEVFNKSIDDIKKYWQDNLSDLIIKSSGELDGDRLNSQFYGGLDLAKSLFAKGEYGQVKDYLASFSRYCMSNESCILSIGEGQKEGVSVGHHFKFLLDDCAKLDRAITEIKK